MSLYDYRNSLNSVEREVFDNAVDMGIFRTIGALYDAGVNDSEIVRVVQKHWEVDEELIIKRLVYTKGDAALDSLTLYMRCLGFSDSKISEFMCIHKVRSKVRSDSELWKLKSKPEKLYEAVQKKKVQKERK